MTGKMSNFKCQISNIKWAKSLGRQTGQRMPAERRRAGTEYAIRNMVHAAAVAIAVLSAACSSPSVTPYAVPTMPRPVETQVVPTVPRPPETRAVPTAEPYTVAPAPTPTLPPTLAVTPTAVPIALDKWQAYQDTEKRFAFRFPPDWGGRGYTQAITRTVLPLAVDVVWLHGPGGAASPEFVLMYNWPALDPIQAPTNDTAWSSVGGLAKIFLYPSCGTTFDSPAPLTLSGQRVMGAKFVVQCDRLYAGYLVGIVHKGMNYGLVVDVPAEDWDAWRPTFETMLASFTLGP